MMDKDIFDSRLLYYGLDDFYLKKETIRILFQCKSIKEQYLYKMYVYSRPFINDTWKDYIWDYLQHDIPDIEFASNYLQMKRKNQR